MDSIETSTQETPLSVPEILHEQEGLVIRRNPKNKFVVARLHYTADPVKRTPEWEAEARMGIDSSTFEREYNISYTAMFGQKVFPQIHDYYSKIVIRHPDWPVIPPEIVCWGGLDFGMRNPTSFHVYTVLKDDDGSQYIAAIWEHFKPTDSAEQLAADLSKCPWWDRIRWIAGDPTLWHKDQMSASGYATSKASQLIESGLKKLIRGNNDEQRWVLSMRQHWADLELRKPTFRILDCCPNMINEFQRCIYVTMSDSQLRNNNFKEQLVDKNNHTLDECKYVLNAGIKLREHNTEPDDRWAQRKKEVWRRHQR